jgi:hypothetical protein
VVGGAGASLGLGEVFAGRDFGLGVNEVVAGGAVLLGLFVVTLLGLGDVVLVLDLTTLGIAFGKTLSSDLPVAEGEGDGADALGDVVGLGESVALATTVGAGEGRDADGLGTDSLGLAATGLADIFCGPVFCELSVVVWVPGMGISRSSARKPRATIIDGLIKFIQDQEFSARSTLSNLLNMRLKLSETTQPNCHGQQCLF